MIKHLTILATTATFCFYSIFALAAPRQEYLYQYGIVAEYPHDPKDFTQGLFISKGLLYEGTGRLKESSLQVKTIDGKLIKKRDLPSHYFGEGIATLNGKIFQLTWKNRVILIWDKAELTRIKTLPYPFQGWGLTSNGHELIASNGSSTLYFFNGDPLKLIRHIQVKSTTGPVHSLNELEYIDNEIWANIWKSNRIARIDPQTGQVKGWLDLTSLAAPYTKKCDQCVLNGIAYDHDEKRLFVTGKYWPKLFEIEITGKKLP